MRYLGYTVRSASLRGVQAYPVQVEIMISAGIPSFSIVGMPDAAIQESRERIRAALKVCGFQVPSDKIVINLAPGSLKKSGSGFDLPIALGLLAATEQIDPGLIEDKLVIGELSLDGKVRSVAGLVAYQQCAAQQGLELITGAITKGSLSLAPALTYTLDHLSQIRGDKIPICESHSVQPHKTFRNFSEVIGQEFAKRALQIAVAGYHNVIMMGSPGSGKSLLAQCCASILPPLTAEEQLDAALIHSVVDGDLTSLQSGLRPFRSPHHSITMTGLVGGGNPVRPGEVSLAHQGVLFLDELSEFKTTVLQQLRQPLEEGVVRITRNEGIFEFPAEFLLVAATNMCPCGFYGDDDHPCSCTPYQIQRYQNKIGGPLMDRIDIRIHIKRAPFFEQETTHTTSEYLQEGVMRAREFASWRKEAYPFYNKKQLKVLLSDPNLTDEALSFLHSMSDLEQLSTRSVYKILSIARTIADLVESLAITEEHISEAFMLRFGNEGR